MKTRMVLILTAVLCSHVIGAQNSEYFAEQTTRSLDAFDLARAWEIVQEWGLSIPDDPDLVYVKADLYFTESFEHENDIPGGVPPGCSSFVAADGGKHYVYCDNAYCASDIDSALKCLATGVSEFPDRLDMRCLMIQLLFVAGRDNDVVAAASSIIDSSCRNGFKWRGRLGVPIDDAGILVVDAMKGYVSVLKENGSTAQAKALSNRIATALKQM